MLKYIGLMSDLPRCVCGHRRIDHELLQPVEDGDRGRCFASTNPLAPTCKCRLFVDERVPTDEPELLIWITRQFRREHDTAVVDNDRPFFTSFSFNLGGPRVVSARCLVCEAILWQLYASDTLDFYRQLTDDKRQEIEFHCYQCLMQWWADRQETT